MIEIAVALVVLLAFITGGLWLLGYRRQSRRARSQLVAQSVLLGLLAVPLVVVSGWKISSSRTFQFFGEIVPNVRVKEKLVALTFDDGPTPDFTQRILSTLKKDGVKATFFLTGAELEAGPALGKQIVADGHELGNHSHSHARMVAKSYSFVQTEIEQTDKAIREAGYQGPIHFRPPYGKKLVTLPYYLGASGRKTITWDVDPDSHPEVAATSSGIVEYVKQRTRPGSIILLHVMYPPRETSMQAVPGIIRALRSDGYRFVTVSELLRRQQAEQDLALSIVGTA